MDKSQIRSEVVEAVTRMWRGSDQRDYEMTVQQFAANGRWHRGGTWLEGHDAIRSALEARPDDMFARHYLSNFVVDIAESGSVAICKYYMASYGGRGLDPDNRESTPANSRGDVQSTLVLIDGEFKISETILTRTFGPPPPVRRP